MVVFALTWFMVGLITNLICIMATGKVYWLAIMLIFCFGYFSPLFIFNYLKIKNFFKNNINWIKNIEWNHASMEEMKGEKDAIYFNWTRIK